MRLSSLDIVNVFIGMNDDPTRFVGWNLRQHEPFPWTCEHLALKALALSYITTSSQYVFQYRLPSSRSDAKSSGFALGRWPASGPTVRIKRFRVQANINLFCCQLCVVVFPAEFSGLNLESWESTASDVLLGYQMKINWSQYCVISSEWKPVQSLFGLLADIPSQHVVAKQRAASPEALHNFNNNGSVKHWVDDLALKVYRTKGVHGFSSPEPHQWRRTTKRGLINDPA